MGKLFAVEKRGVEITVNELNGKYEMVVGGESFQTHPSKFGSKFAWTVSKELMAKHFGNNQNGWLEHDTAKQIVTNNLKKGERLHRNLIDNTNDFNRTGKRYE